MPKYWDSKFDQLHCEAYATFLLVQAIYRDAVKNDNFPIRKCRASGERKTLIELVVKMNERVYRRSYTESIFRGNRRLA